MIGRIVKNRLRFDELTNFRLVNAYIQSFTSSIVAPLFISLKGSLLSIEMITLFVIMGTLAVNANKHLAVYGIAGLYKIGIIIQIAIILGSGIYYYDKVIFLYIDLIIITCTIAIFSTFSIVLNQHQAETQPNIVKEFNIVRNSIVAEAFLIGLGLSFIVITFLGEEWIIAFYIAFQSMFAFWLLKNYTFYDDLN